MSLDVYKGNKYVFLYFVIYVWLIVQVIETTEKLTIILIPDYKLWFKPFVIAKMIVAKLFQSDLSSGCQMQMSWNKSII